MEVEVGAEVELVVAVLLEQVGEEELVVEEQVELVVQVCDIMLNQ